MEEITEEMARNLELKDRELLNKIDRKLNLLFEEIIEIERMLRDKRKLELEKEIESQEREIKYKKEDILIDKKNEYRMFEEKNAKFRNGYYI